MTYPISLKKLDRTIEFYSEVVTLVQDAKTYLKEHAWCKEIYAGWLFTNVGYAVCIFLFEIENKQSSEDNLIWVIVGDFPPMYLDTYNISTTKDVVEAYIELSTEWVKNAEEGQSLEECYPLDATPDKSSIELLKNKISRLKTEILLNIDELNFNVAINH